MATKILIPVCFVGLIAAAAPFISGSMAPEEDDGPKLTHTIARSNLSVTVTEQGTLESSNNTEIKCRVRGTSTVLWVIETGTEVEEGDELIKLDPSTIEDRINTQEIAYQRARATHTNSKTAVAVAKIAIKEYQEGTYVSQMKALQKDLAISKSNLRTAENFLKHSQRMFKKGYASELEMESNRFTLEQATLELELKETEIKVLKEFTQAKQLEELNSTLESAEATLESDTAALSLEKARLDREKDQLKNCIITAPSAGMVIYPSAAEWKETPDVEEGATVRQDQVLLLIPDVNSMQVKVGIHESKVDRLTVGMPARVTMLDQVIDGKVKEIATVTKPAGWWTGNVVKYDTIVELKPEEGITLKPGMSVEVEIMLDSYRDELTIPVGAVVEHESMHYCWVKTSDGFQRRKLDLGDTNDQFMVVKGGVKSGDEVVINPRAHVKEAQEEALKPIAEADKKAAGDSKEEDVPEKEDKKTSEKKTAEDPVAAIFKSTDKNGDGALTIDEYQDEHKQYFPVQDADKDDKVTLPELKAFLQKAKAASEAAK